MTTNEKNQIAEAILELAEQVGELASTFRTDVGYYKTIADVLEEMNYYQNREKMEQDKKDRLEKIKM
jgi:hypothetical protein